MAESEIYRVEIPIIINDQTEQPLERARERINRFQREAEKTNSRLQRMAARIYRFRMMVHDRVTPTLQKIQKTLPNLVKKTWTITLKAKDKVTDVVKRIIGFVTSPLTLLGAGAGLTAAIGFPLNVAGEMDRARRSIELFSGSAEAGRRNFEELVNLAIKSPIYEVPFVVKEAGQLLAKGMNIDFVKRALNAFGNAAMYTGASLEQLELAFYGFGQIASVGTLSMEELRQVTENLNVPLNWITQELGITGDKLKELGKLGIPAKRAMEAIVRTLEKRFPVKNFNNDLFALIANIKEAGRTIVWRFGKGMLQPVIRILQDLSGSLDPASEKFKQPAES